MRHSIPSPWRMVKLGVCLQRRKDTVMPATLPADSIGLVGLEDIQVGGRGGISIRPTKPQEIESLKTRFAAGDLLYGKLRPNLNKVGIAHQGGLCSTEIWAFGQSPLINSQYAAFFLASSFFVNRVASLTKGANLPRLDTQAFDSIEIPIPPLSEQQRIVEILQEAESIRRLRAEAEVKTVELVPALFRGLFGEIGTNSSRWPIVPVSHFVESFQGGKSLTGTEGEFDTSRPRVLKISAVTSGVLVPSESKALPSSYDPPDEHFVKPGDLLITRANTAELVGATALVGEDCPSNLVLPDKIWRFVWKDDFKGTPEFVWALFQERATRQALGNIATGTGGSMKNISMKKLMQMRVVWPPRELQETFSKALRELADLRNAVEGDKSFSVLQASLSAHAFSGQLTADWREAYADKLALEARERDDALKNAGPIFSRSRRATIQEIEGVFEPRTDGIYSDLNREQCGLFEEI